MESNYCAGCRFYDPCKMYCHCHLAGIECIKRCSMIRDVVEVVRCKDCKNWDTTWKPHCYEYLNPRYYCGITDLVTNGDWFCADGERKDDEK